MKKSKLSLGLVTGLIGVLAITGCSSVTANKEAVVTFKGYDGEDRYAIVTDEMYNSYIKTSDGISKFYEQILEVLIRNEFNTTNSPVKTEKSLSTIESESWDDVLDQKESAKDNAETNGTTFKTEWKSILDSNGVENEKELYELFIYQKEKEQITDWYLKENLETLKKEYIGVDNAGAEVDVHGGVASRYPYHLRHILVNANEGSAGSMNRDTITSAIANKLYNVTSALAEGKIASFGSIAQSMSEDTGSAANYGDVGIVTTKASTDGSLTMVNEFQLGVYAYDNLFARTTVNEGLSKGLGLSGMFANLKDGTSEQVGTAYKNIVGNEITKVPYSVFNDLEKYKDTETLEDGTVLYDNDQMIYPRNILWNKYLNRHNVFVITNNTRTYTTDIDTDTSARNDDPDLVGSTIDATVNVLSDVNSKTCGFRKVKDLPYLKTSTLYEGESSDLAVLTDEDGRVILGVRSQYGVHYVTMQKSVYEYSEANIQSKAPYVSLEDYYTTETPSSKDYPQTEDGKPVTSYVNYYTADKTTYNKRAEEVKNAVKQFDTTYDYRLYEYLYDLRKANLTFKYELDSKITDYVSKQREINTYNQDLGLNRAWEDYLELLQKQQHDRNQTDAMVPEGCIMVFDDGYVGNAYAKGGTCYYGNK